MTQATKQHAPGETGPNLNAPQPDIPDDPGRAIGYAIYHPDHDFAETCSSAIEDFTDQKNAGSAILLYRQRDVAAADRLQRGWSDEATIIPVRIPELSRPVGDAVPAQLYALRHPDGGWVVCEHREDPKLYETSTFRTFDECAAERHALGLSDCEIVPLVELTRPSGETSERPETSGADEPELAPLVSYEPLSECPAIMQAAEDLLSWMNETEIVDAVEGNRSVHRLTCFLKLLREFDRHFRIRKARPEDEVGNGRLIIEDKASVGVLPAKSADLIIRTMVKRELLAFDDAGVLHPTKEIEYVMIGG